MTVFSSFDEIISQINQKIKIQRDKINGAIDIPDWEEAQNVIKQAYENTATLKALKSRVSLLKNDFDSSKLFSDNQSKESNDLIEPANNDPQPHEEEITLPDKTEIAELPKETENPIAILKEEIDSLPETEKMSSADEQYPDEIAVPNEAVSPIVDETSDEVWHSLSEDFQNTKINAVRINGKVYYVKDMTDALINVCEWLWKKDSECFTRMLDTKIAHGKKRKYFSIHPFDISFFHDFNHSTPDRYYKKLSNAEIYVWVNTNSNAKANLIANMLIFYGLPNDIVMLAVRNDYKSKERDYNGRTVNPDIGTPLHWQDDSTDTHVYSSPTIHQKKQMPTPAQDVLQEEPQAEVYPSKVIESRAVIQFCEKMILKRPHKMMIAFTSSEISSIFESRKNRALSRFQSPHRLSNGIWVETEGITEQKLKQIEKYCDWKVL